MNLYLAGAIDNNSNYLAEFKSAKANLVSAGYNVISPVEDLNTGEHKTWLSNIITCLSGFNEYKIDGIAVIADCVDCLISAGVDIEKIVARKLRIPVRTVCEWLIMKEAV